MTTETKKNILERIADLESSIKYLLEENNSLKGNLAAMVELNRAIIKASGENFGAKVQAVVAEHQRELQAKEQEHQKAILNALVAKGDLVRAEAVTEDSIIAVKKTDAEGNLEERVHGHYMEFPVEARLRLVNQPVGAVIELPGLKLEVLEIFRATPKSTESVK